MSCKFLIAFACFEIQILICYLLNVRTLNVAISTGLLYIYKIDKFQCFLALEFITKFFRNSTVFETTSKCFFCSWSLKNILQHLEI